MAFTGRPKRSNEEGICALSYGGYQLLDVDGANDYMLTC